MRGLWKEGPGHAVTEYVLLVVLVALAAITAIMGFGVNLKTVFSNAAGNVHGAAQVHNPPTKSHTSTGTME